MPDKIENNTRKRPRELPFVEDYRPYTGGQLAQLKVRKTTHKEHWDQYYRNNTLNGYRDRHYILREFSELREALERLKKNNEATLEECVWMEAGCGVGNAVFPILKDYGDVSGWRVVGFDISTVAIKLLREKQNTLPHVEQEKFTAWVLNPVEQDIAPIITASVARQSRPRGDGLVDFVSMIFVLCSIPVEEHAVVLRRIAACMKEGGVFFFRDYCVDDHAEKRFSAHCRVEANTFSRTNGTLSHFFSVSELRDLFCSVGFELINVEVVEREVVNRREGMNLQRRFLQGRFRKIRRIGDNGIDIVGNGNLSRNMPQK